MVEPLYLAIDAGASFYGWGVCYNELKKEFSKRTKLIDVKEQKHFQKGKLNGSVFHGIVDHNMNVAYDCVGDRNFAYTFFEAELSRKHLDKLNQYEVVFCGSTWCVDKLKELGVHHARPLIQGVDIEKFYPLPKIKKSDRFVIFSGGKFEYRKGQDLVLAAFKILQHKYKDMELVTLWQNAWPESVNTMALSNYIHSEEFEPGTDWLDYISKTCAQNRIFPNRATHYPLIHNRDVVKLIAHTDVGLFPNRCEGGTNLMLMEYMACGKPAIVSTNSGHLDVLTDSNCVQLKRNLPAQTFLNDQMVFDYREPDLEEILSAIELAYKNRDLIRMVGDEARKHVIKNLQWKHSVDMAMADMNRDWNGHARYEPSIRPRQKIEMPWLWNQLGLLGTGVEVGVFKGEYSSHILNKWKGKKLFLVDRWEHVEGWDDIANDPQEKHDERFRNVSDMFGADPRVSIMRMDSIEASKRFGDGELDWVFIDADHTREACLADLEAWYPKVKVGGVVSGHDYTDMTSQLGVFGVKSAVNAFALKLGKTVNVTNELHFPCWWMTV